MKKTVKKEIEVLIEKFNLECSIREFQDKVDWICISKYQKLSEKFIREFQDKVDWYCISKYQKLSEEFIREFQDKVDWDYILAHQKLSEEFIREFKDKVNWFRISAYQNLSEEFIREFQDKVNWDFISEYQKLSEEFIREFQDKVDVEVQKAAHQEKLLEQKRKEVVAYCKKHNLKLFKNYFYAFRNHDQYGRGEFNKTQSYQSGEYYQDWHCDMREDVENSFGFGIWPEGNTKVKVKIEDWGCAVDRNDGKARVWGFEIV